MRQMLKFITVTVVICISFLATPTSAQHTAGATATIFNGFVVGITVTNGGSGYAFPPLVTISGGGGSGATAFSAISDGAVISITVSNAGSGYTSVPQVIIDAPSLVPFPANLVANLPISGNIVDTGPNALVVVNNNSSSLTTNRFNAPASAVSFNGVNQNVYFPFNSLLYPTEITLSMWVRFGQYGNACIARGGNGSTDGLRGFQLLTDTGSQSVIYQDFGGGGSNPSITIPITNFVIGKWTHLVISRATNMCAMYLNGARVGLQTNLTQYAKPQFTPLSLGANNSDPSGFFYYWNGGLDDFHLFNKALNDVEVLELYNAESFAGNPPQITSQPTNQTVPAGTNVSFVVGVTSDTPASYQWQLNGVNINGATSSTLNLTNVQIADEGGYRVLVSTPGGTTNSATALLRVNPSAPVITLHPTNLTVAATSNATFSVVAIGSIPLTYQWRVNTVALPDATNSSLVLSNVQGFSMGTYSVAVSNAYGFAISTGASLTVTPTAPRIISQPTNQNILLGSSAAFSVTAVGSVPFTYQWRFNGTNIAGATSSNYNVINAQFTNAGNYSVAVSNLAGGVISSNALLTVYSPPVITNPPANLTVFPGTNVSFQVGVTGTSPLAYQWFRNGFRLAGSTNALLALTNVQSFDSGDYSVVITNAFGQASTNAALKVATRPSAVVAWADNSAGQTDVPPGLTNIIAVAGGNFHSLALRSSGTVVGWGLNGHAQALPPVGLNNVTAIAAGDVHSLALRSDGRVVGWGDNAYGQSQPPATLSNVTAIAAGSIHSLALKRDGTITAWGTNNYGQVTPPANLSNVVAIASGEFHSLALKNDGTVVAWGNNGYGQTNIPAGLTNVAAIAAGLFHSMALKRDGKVVCWGDDTYGQVSVPNDLSNAVAIAAGEIPSIAQTAGGDVIGWGDDFFDQVKPPEGLSNVVSVAAGYYHNLALTLNPFILQHPVGLSLPQNAPAQFNVTAGGVGPHTFQWRFNGDAMPGKTNSSLSITSAQPVDAGAYSVVVANPYASLISSNAALVVQPFQFNADAGALQMSATGFSMKLDSVYAPNALVIYASTNLINWEPVFTNPPVTGPVMFVDPKATNFSKRFYRASEE